MNTPVPKKSLGQHWLHNETTLDAIVDCADVQAGDAVLEVGPGLGTLTKRLLVRGAHVTAVEFDKNLAQNLFKSLIEDGPIVRSAHRSLLRARDEDTQSIDGDLTVVNEDILQFDLSQLQPGYKVVANIPYYLTSNLIRVLTESTNPFDMAAMLIQKEVAERAAAKPGQMSLLSISAQYYCKVSLGPVVPAELFTPPPKVDSQVLVLNYRTEPLFPDVDAKQFFHLVRAGFSQKRKTLQNALSGGLAISKDHARELCEAANIPPTQRAQALSLDDWHALYAAAK